jgi:hypothetical protein
MLTCTWRSSRPPAPRTARGSLDVILERRVAFQRPARRVFAVAYGPISPAVHSTQPHIHDCRALTAPASRGPARVQCRHTTHARRPHSVRTTHTLHTAPTCFLRVLVLGWYGGTGLASASLSHTASSPRRNRLQLPALTPTLGRRAASRNRLARVSRAWLPAAAPRPYSWSSSVERMRMYVCARRLAY